jgi:hypothetical protein
LCEHSTNFPFKNSFGKATAKGQMSADGNLYVGRHADQQMTSCGLSGDAIIFATLQESSLKNVKHFGCHESFNDQSFKD